MKVYNGVKCYNIYPLYLMIVMVRSVEIVNIDATSKYVNTISNEGKSQNSLSEET